MISALKTDVGCGKRGKGNEDNLISLKLHIEKGPDRGIYHLFAVADGMGGHEKGELASALVIRGIVKTFVNKLVSDKGRFSDKDKPLEPSLLLQECVEMANLLIYNISSREKHTSQMGSTIVSALIKNGKLFIAHVGDSRAYLIRKDKFERLTTDHSLVQALYDGHSINTSELYKHPQKNVITRALGFHPKIEVEINEKRKGKPVTLQNNDVIILCSDGISGVLEEEELLLLVEQNNYNPHVIVDEIIKLAKLRETDDNATVICNLIQRKDIPGKS
jgi:protein phosphatase